MGTLINSEMRLAWQRNNPEGLENRDRFNWKSEIESKSHP